MNIQSITFENYKAFALEQTLNIKPLTLLIGKNSSGKSSLAKLFTLLSNSLSGTISEPLQLVNHQVVLGAEFLDLVYNHVPSVPLKFQLLFDTGVKLDISIVQQVGEYNLTIFEWGYTSATFHILLKNNPENIYTDEQGILYRCKFKGFLPIEIIDKDGKNIVDKLGLQVNMDVDYIGPFRILPDRQFHLTGQIIFEKTGIKGEFAYPILGVSKSLKEDLHEKVGDWYEKHFGNWRLYVEDKNRPFIELKLVKGATEVNIVDVGQGMNQALPLVVRSLIAKQNSIIIIEQPELHLHPAAHGDLGELFVQSAKENGQRFIIETHSENILLRIRTLIVEGAFGLIPDDVVIYWVDDRGEEGHFINEITIDDEGVLTDWPSGVFNENLIEIQEMRKAVARKKKEKGI